MATVTTTIASHRSRALSSFCRRQFSRYFYYIGRIKTIQLEYNEALNYLQEALRKAPQTGVVGFRITVNKAIALVQLLKGEIPPRSMFTPKEAQLREALVPYMELTQAVRNGDLSRFKIAAECVTPRHATPRRVGNASRAAALILILILFLPFVLVLLAF